MRLLSLFSMYLRVLFWDIFFRNSDIGIANYADDKALCACSSELDYVIFKIQKNSERILRWFHNSNLISNAEKGHLIVSPKENLEIQVSSYSNHKK